MSFTVLTVDNPITVLDSENDSSLPSTKATTTNVSVTASTSELESQASKDYVPSAVLPTKLKRKFKITPPSQCMKCTRETKGQCAPCKIKELKMMVREKDKQLAIAKCCQDKLEIKILQLKARLQESRKKLNTSGKRVSRMKRYLQVTSATLFLKIVVERQKIKNIPDD